MIIDQIFFTNKQKMLEMKKPCKGNPNVAMRKVRIICNDPDGTDSSSDDDESNDLNNEYGKRVKRIISEVYIPMDNSRKGSLSSVGVVVTRKIEGVRRKGANESRPILYEDELFQYLLENRPPLRKPEQDFELGKEELDWINNL